MTSQQRAADGRERARRELIREAGSVVALTGAGISVPSGIPDFRSPGTGLWENVDPMEVAHIDAFRRDPERFWRFYGDRFAVARDKQPNGAHEALAELERRGLLDAVITQNIDRLHRRAGTRELIEVHGTIAHSSCLRCGARFELDEVRARLGGGRRRRARAATAASRSSPTSSCSARCSARPRCSARSELAAGADLLLCVGSSLEVYPVAQLPVDRAATGGAARDRHPGPDAVRRRRRGQARRRCRGRAGGGGRRALAPAHG